MPTEAEREEIIREVQSLLDEIMDDTTNPYTRSRINSAKQLVRKLSPGKSDGGQGDR